MAKIQVARTDTGDKVWIPEHWMKDSILRRGFRTLPSERANQTSEDAASGESPANQTAPRGSNKPKE